MGNSEEVRRDSKSRRARNDYVKNVVAAYLQRRNISGKSMESTKANFLTYASVGREVSRPNSILFSAYNCDAIVIQNNFSKFLIWFDDLSVRRKIGHDLRPIIAPLFCHLYLDILGGGHPEEAPIFYKKHQAEVEKYCENGEKTLLNSLLSDDKETNKLRDGKYVLCISNESKAMLMKFIADNCHVLFLQLLQTWFDFEPKETCLKLAPSKEETPIDLNSDSSKFKKLTDVIKNLAALENKLIFSTSLHNSTNTNCGILKRSQGVIVFNSDNLVKIRELHGFNALPGAPTSLGDATHVQEITLHSHKAKIYSIDISNNYLTSICSDGAVVIYSVPSFELIKQCSGHTGPGFCVKISPNEQYIASGAGDRTVRLWNTENGYNLRIFAGHSKAVTCVDFHPNCLYVVSGSWDKNLRMWSISDGSPLRLFVGSKGLVFSVLFNPKGQCIASVADDKKIRIWDVLSGKSTHEIKSKEASVCRLAWSTDGVFLCGGTFDGSVKIWDYSAISNTENKHIKPIHTVEGHHEQILSLEYAFGTFGFLSSRPPNRIGEVLDMEVQNWKEDAKAIKVENT